ncbi:hypothetical protein ASPZODRAFT_137440 [Penicilliopsis zonata CBS 506.65]|uniref:Ornithine cyclodeaminase n=1 Tax=Penicilliopsis zonata CBS 506.65 TaxID=1073090 RepID=A0A1L9S4S8_9EURO|nr:hypothetical protein ASPZODRAFT_137440 [Penicilliopsis zonata CBS 506.65]OJJ42164.1 hypothetical protein ASPZODRAFT_137440 [Penicilliopsis zonata CBS 506.65]
MPSAAGAVTGIKVVTLPGAGGPPAGSISLFDAASGDLRGVLNAEELTAFRTALASMLVFTERELEPTDAAGLVMFGAGKQAEWHLRLALLLGPRRGSIATVTVVNRSPASLAAFDAAVLAPLRREYPAVQFHALARDGNDAYDAQLQTAVADAAAIFCCTPSTSPLFPHRYLSATRTNRYISLIGSYKPHMQEVDSQTCLAGDLLAVDSRSACLKEAGELIQAGVSPDAVTEIGEVMASLAQDEALQNILRRGSVVFKCVGLGIMDVVAGDQLLQLAEQKSVGVATSF